MKVYAAHSLMNISYLQHTMDSFHGEFSSLRIVWRAPVSIKRANVLSGYFVDFFEQRNG